MSNNNLNDYGIYIFRKDLRIIDNRGLIKLSEKCKEIIPIFIFDPYQVDLTNKNKNYLSFPALRFICESIKDLNNQLIKLKSKLNVFYGNPTIVLKYIIKQLEKVLGRKKIIIGFNSDYTEYSIIRDNTINIFCKNKKIELIINHDDNVLCDMELLLKEVNIPYKQYGAFKKNMFKSKAKFNKPNYTKIKFSTFNIKFDKSLSENEIDEFWEEYFESNLTYNPVEIGSRTLGLKILEELKKFKNYNNCRDILSYETTHLSAYLNFGLISEREFYWSIIKNLSQTSQLINQIIWREYYLCLLRFLEKANSYKLHIDPRYDKLKWTIKQPLKTSKVWIEWDKLLNSNTGFLLVDAAVKELKHTGFMHNRCRMIVGVFSVKYLKINPLCRYIGLNDWFSRYLVDCSTSQNKLNSQWVTELDFPGKKFAPTSSPIAGRPMNISNIMIKKWDPECKYIKKWLPHLANIDNKIIINWDTKYIDTLHPGPIFDSKTRYNEWIKLCENI